jgi:hypothetical protein
MLNREPIATNRVLGPRCYFLAAPRFAMRFHRPGPIA